jgi:trafficking protein particle complex subunit 8
MAASKYVASKLSNITISAADGNKAFLKNFTPIGSFLIKNETKYIQVFNQNANTEEFNSILSSVDKHMTVWVTWQAVVCDSNSVRRQTNGQHFIQLRNLYEP